MFALLAQTRRLDRLAVALSSVCLVHCLATAILLGVLASVSGFLGQPIFHEVGLSLAMVLAAVALGRGALDHGFLLPTGVGALGLILMAVGLSLHESGGEPVFTAIGVTVLALAHRLNILAAE